MLKLECFPQIIYNLDVLLVSFVLFGMYPYSSFQSNNICFVHQHPVTSDVKQ